MKIISTLILYIVISAFSAFVPLTATAQMKWNSAYQNYIDKYKNVAIDQMKRHHIPASITLAQGLLESGAGKSSLATRGNNHFGIKCHDWTGPTMMKNDDAPNECFRVYGNAMESYEDHSLFLKRKRYAPLFELNLRDYKGWANGLKKCGYATSPTYAQQLINIIELYKLYEYDNAKGLDKFILDHSGAYVIRAYNKNYYVVARKGDTFRSLGKELGISYKKLAKYNERDRDDVLSEGDTVYLKKKQKRATKDFKRRPHTIKAGESMYSIAQFYGIRLANLYKMNHLSPDYSPRVGDQLRVY